MNVLGIDYGTKRIGLALKIDTVVVPLDIICADKYSLSKIIQIIKEKNVTVVKVGLPKLLSGKHGNTAKLAKKFATQLQKELNFAIKIELIDERFTSKIATGQLNYLNSKQKRGRIDSLAATHLLD
jgi:putative Holliday junction resolvase